ncbi:unnamed protein product, partial [Rotaria magnacalcarata]
MFRHFSFRHYSSIPPISPIPIPVHLEITSEKQPSAFHESVDYDDYISKGRCWFSDLIDELVSTILLLFLLSLIVGIHGDSYECSNN